MCGTTAPLSGGGGGGREAKLIFSGMVPSGSSKLGKTEDEEKEDMDVEGWWRNGRWCWTPWGVPLPLGSLSNEAGLMLRLYQNFNVKHLCDQQNTLIIIVYWVGQLNSHKLFYVEF